MLSSIEVAAILDADVIEMQNFAHVKRVLSKCNRMPSRDQGSDFSRVRHSFLNSHAVAYRQTIVVSQIVEPSLVGLFHRHCNSHAGKVRLRSLDHTGVSTSVPIRQVFQQLKCGSLQDMDDIRFAYFRDTIFEKLKPRTILFVPLYEDFLKIRNLLHERLSSYVAVHEYSRPSEVSRGRARFFRGERDILLYTGRAHFFFRYHLRGCHHLCLYGLPNHSHHYVEIASFLGEAALEGVQTSCTSLFTKFDQFSLQRIVGTKHYKQMLQTPKETFVLT
mmetsp:Transcript_9300/g.12014  ORF Transcript_9300/g.12014 Transcript_9300/m.12014 type:complete len:276 (+) Transcript_9300:1458-2285(+)